VDLESAVDELYAGSPDDFIERRKALVAQARAAKDRPLATAVGALRRPTRSAWLVNLYAREAPDELGALLDLGEALQAAQQQLSGPDLRRLSVDRGKALTAATRRAVALGHDHGYDAPEAARLEVTQTLQAALADPDVAEQVRTGTVTQAQSYGGFGAFALAPPTTATAAEPQSRQAESPEAEASAAGTADDEADDEADERRAEAESRLLATEAALSEAADDADAATTRADELADRVEALRAELADAERAESDAQRSARSARKRVSELEADVRSAREAYEAL
jgi:hypothetical protein